MESDIGCVRFRNRRLYDGTASRLAAYLHTPEGFKEWQRGDEELSAKAYTAANRYRSSHTMEDLQEYEKALPEYLDHGFTLYKAYEAYALQNQAKTSWKPGFVT